MARQPLHVALYSGLYVRADAISISVRLKVQVLRALAEAGAPLRFTVFTHGSHYDEPWVRSVGGAHDVAVCPEFRDADVHIFEFGIRYDLFDCVFMLPPDRTVLAVYHNVTPPEFADSEALRVVLQQSLVQKYNLFRAQSIACVSEFNRDDLLTFGVDAGRLTVLHLPPAVGPVPRVPRVDDRVELLFVGRFVPAKGVIDLIHAVELLEARGVGGFRLTLAGNRTFSSPAVMEEIDRLLAEHGDDTAIRVVTSPDDDTLAALYASSDTLVIPSYHEGYCLPVVEAMSAACAVIAYASANLPYIVDGLGTLVPTGDVIALADAIQEFIETTLRARADRRDVPDPTWRAAASKHVAQYSLEAYRRGFLIFLESAIPATPRGDALRRWLGAHSEVAA